MSTEPFYIPQYDRQPAYRARAQYAVNSPVDITDATIVCIMKNERNGTMVVSRSTVGISVTNPASGDFQYSWQESDTAIAGHYKIEFEIDPVVGQKFTVPSDPEELARVIILESTDGE